jgi:hypothetical protein
MVTAAVGPFVNVVVMLIAGRLFAIFPGARAYMVLLQPQHLLKSVERHNYLLHAAGLPA